MCGETLIITVAVLHISLSPSVDSQLSSSSSLLVSGALSTSLSGRNIRGIRRALANRSLTSYDERLVSGPIVGNWCYEHVPVTVYASAGTSILSLRPYLRSDRTSMPYFSF
ncbi:hypothetical protein Bbelb_026760 [Branchiostoma belcheri]|nr:hypothetical protein Bbelb_026760 [Branchiostoma belcheri]